MTTIKSYAVPASKPLYIDIFCDVRRFLNDRKGSVYSDLPKGFHCVHQRVCGVQLVQTLIRSPFLALSQLHVTLQEPWLFFRCDVT